MTRDYPLFGMNKKVPNYLNLNSLEESRNVTEAIEQCE